MHTNMHTPIDGIDSTGTRTYHARCVDREAVTLYILYMTLYIYECIHDIIYMNVGMTKKILTNSIQLTRMV